MLLAETTAVPAWAWGTGFAAAVMVALCAIAAGMNQLDDFFARRKDKPAAADVRSETHEKFVLKTDFDAHVAANAETHDGIFRKIGGVERGVGEKLERIRSEMHDMELRLTKHGEERAEKTHNRINEVLSAVSELRGQVNERQK